VASGLILVDLSGSVSRAELIGYYAALRDDPALRPGLVVFADCRRVTSGPSFLELHAVANAQALLPPGLRPTRAAVLVNKGWLFGIVRQFAAMIERLGIRVMPFVDEADARRWLGVSDGPMVDAYAERVAAMAHSDSNGPDSSTDIA
jgi:hypothetical protein